jgi:hypothetical protein
MILRFCTSTYSPYHRCRQDNDEHERDGEPRRGGDSWTAQRSRRKAGGDPRRGGDSLFVKNQWFAVVCSTWRASLSKLVIEQHLDWLSCVLDRAQREGLAVVNVTDAALAGLPDAYVRRMIAARTKKWTSRAPKGFARSPSSRGPSFEP